MDEEAKFRAECDAEIRSMRANERLRNVTSEWIQIAGSHRYAYHFEWMRRPIIQYPQDLVALQEIIFRVRPDLIIETGIAHGGSLVFNASMLALLDYEDAVKTDSVLDPANPSRQVLGIDIDIRAHNLSRILNHPLAGRIEMFEGSSVSDEMVQRVHSFAREFQTILVCLDSNHTHEHVLAELEAYAGLTSINSYCIVFDTLIQDLPGDRFVNRPWGVGNNPKTAVDEFLNGHEEFRIDTDIEDKLLITVAPGGFLRRLR